MVLVIPGPATGSGPSDGRATSRRRRPPAADPEPERTPGPDLGATLEPTPEQTAEATPSAEAVPPADEAPPTDTEP